MTHDAEVIRIRALTAALKAATICTRPGCSDPVDEDAAEIHVYGRCVSHVRAVLYPHLAP